MAWFHEFGGPEARVYEDAPDPKPGPEDVLVRVRAGGVNHVDLDLREWGSRYTDFFLTPWASSSLAK